MTTGSASDKIGTSALVTALKAVAEPTRLRILLLLRDSELNVKDLTQILGQSQPRLSRHLKLLTEAGLVERFRDGSWVYFHLAERGQNGNLAVRLLNAVDQSDPELVRDQRRITRLKRDREAAAQDYFREHAGEWDQLRTLHISDARVESEMRALLGAGPFDRFIDLGTGTGRVLELFSPNYREGLGVDVNHAMLSFARANLAKTGHTNTQIRHADIYNLSIPDADADAVVMHQVLHYLSDPAGALTEAARIVKPGGNLLIVDFAPHELEFLRENQAHERLGFSRDQVEGWMNDAGLNPIEFRELAPDTTNGSQNLTVSLWLATRTPTTAPTHRSNTKRETTLEET